MSSLPVKAPSSLRYWRESGENLWFGISKYKHLGEVCRGCTLCDRRQGSQMLFVYANI